MKIQRRLLAAALCLALLAGCASRVPEEEEKPENGESPPEQEETLPESRGEEQYSIRISETYTWTMDRQGNDIAADPEEVFHELIPWPDGEARYQYRQRTEDTGVRDEWGSPVVRTFRALYDMEGNLLVDYAETNYLSAFGEYVIRQDERPFMVEMSELPDGFHTALYHVPTGEERYAGAFESMGMGDVYLLCDGWRTPLGVVDGEGNPVSGFPAPKTYYSAMPAGDYFTAAPVHPYEQGKERRVEYLLDRDFNELFAYDWISSVYLGPDRFLSYKDGSESGVFTPEDGVLFSVRDASVEYYDGELAVVTTGTWRSEEDPPVYELMTADKEVLAGGFSYLTSAQRYGDQEPAAGFIGMREGKAVLLDRGGKELFVQQVGPAIAVHMLSEGLYTYEIETEDGISAGLLGPELEVLIPTGRYEYISSAYDYGFWAQGDEKGPALLTASKYSRAGYEPGGVYRTDILDAEGNVVVDNVTTLEGFGPDRIALQRGFDAGLMDWQGNWIVKKTIFQGLLDD